MSYSISWKEDIFKRGMKHFESSRFKKALEEFEKLSHVDYPPSFLMLRLFYSLDGLIGGKNHTTKQFWHLLADKYSAFFDTPTTDPVFIFCCGYFLQKIKKDTKLAFQCFEEATQNNYALAQFYLGDCYRKGLGTRVDLTLATRYYELSANQGFSLAQNKLGICYTTGTGVSRDRVKAAAIFKLSAEQGYSPGQNNLGLSYEKGYGVTKDPVLAVKYYQLSAAQGNSSSQCAFGRCLEYGIGVSKDLNLAVKYYLMSNTGRSKNALLRLVNRVPL